MTMPAMVFDLDGMLIDRVYQRLLTIRLLAFVEIGVRQEKR